MESSQIAEILSEILGPFFWLPVLVLAFVWRGDLVTSQVHLLLPTILVFQVVIPLAYIYLSTRLGWVSAWDEPKRRERYPLLLLLGVCCFISLALVFQFGNRLLFQLYLIILILVLVLSFITLLWKISLHMSMNTAGSLIINYLYNWQLPFLFLTIPLIYWARLKLRRHTPTQLLVAFLVSSVIVVFGLLFLK